MIYNNRLLTWRAQFNPLRHLTLAKVVLLLQQAEMGYFADLMWLYKFIEKRDATLRAVKERRLNAIKKLDWAIKIKDGYEGAQANQQQEYLQSIYEGIDNLNEAFKTMAMATFRGFAHLEKHINSDGDITHLEPVPQWLWARKLPMRDWLYNQRAIQSSMGIPINPASFIIREVEDPVDEIAVIAFIRKSMSQKDWDGFIETYGIPPLFVELPVGIGAASVSVGGSLESYQDLAERVISDGRGVLPNGAKLATPTSGVTGQNPFKEHIAYQDEQIVLAGTSGQLTMLNQPTGMGSGQSESHQDTFFDLAKGEALEISEHFQRQIDGPALNRQFPDQDIMVYFELAYQEVEDEDPIQDAVALASAGYDIDMKQLSEKTGYKLTKKVEPGMGGGGQNANDDYDPDYDQIQNVGRRSRKGLSVISNSLRAVTKSRDRDLLEKLEQFSKKLPVVLEVATRK